MRSTDIYEDASRFGDLHARFSDGKANRIIPATISRYQANSGIMLMRMPGARHFMTPTIISIAARIEATSMKDGPSSHRYRHRYRKVFCRWQAADT